MGLEPFNLRLLKALPHARECRFHELFSADEVVEVEPGFSFNALYDEAVARLNVHGNVDGILNYWDFPSACLAPLLGRDFGLATPDLHAVATCEHKLWAREKMRECLPDLTPAFCPVDPFHVTSPDDIELDYPYWLKPAVSHSSYLGFRIEKDEDLNAALAVIRDKIGHFGKPFQEFLSHLGGSAGSGRTEPSLCIAEEIISTDNQVTLEGYVWRGRPVVIGCIDSVRVGGGQSSFARYDYPSRLPEAVLLRMREATVRLLTHLGYDNGAFNIEFFWDEPSDRISILEVNSRVSKSHSPLYLMVDGQSQQGVPLDLSLGVEPRFRNEGGDWPHASKFMVRLFQDGEMRRLPSKSELQYLKSHYPETWYQVLVKEGQRLSHLSFQDSYSFEIADLFFGGQDQTEILKKYAQAMEILPFDVHLTAPADDAVS